MSPPNPCDVISDTLETLRAVQTAELVYVERQLVSLRELYNGELTRRLQAESCRDDLRATVRALEIQLEKYRARLLGERWEG